MHWTKALEQSVQLKPDSALFPTELITESVTLSHFCIMKFQGGLMIDPVLIADYWRGHL